MTKLPVKMKKQIQTKSMPGGDGETAGAQRTTVEQQEAKAEGKFLLEFLAFVETGLRIVSENAGKNVKQNDPYRESGVKNGGRYFYEVHFG